MRTHLEHIRAAARDNEFVDAPETIRLHILLTEALESWDTSTTSSAPCWPTPCATSSAPTAMRTTSAHRLQDDAGGRRGRTGQDQAVRAGLNGLGAPAQVTTRSSRARLQATT